ncbi:unnamed protein product [Calicophoron daubneyi]|uniref:GRAM domain-containing protein n=1 Tax=Calicophoron daubneyi TaxID=300641 RepID=A0AAV2T433_CALDB
MSLNQSSAGGVDKVLLFYGERLIIFYDGCELKLGPPLKGSHTGRAYLTSHRVIFLSSRQSTGLQSFSMPFILMRNVEIQQPVFGANRIAGRIKAEANGGWEGETEFSITFNRGGAIEFGKALIELGKRACAAKHKFRAPPPYSPPKDASGATQYYSCPPPAYSPPYGDPYYGFVGQHEAFSTPPAQSMYYVDAPPPYPGAIPEVGVGWGGAQPAPPNQQQAYGYPPSQPYPPQQYGPPSGSNWNSTGEPMSAAHAAKAREAAESANNAIRPGYYFPEDPHTVYTTPSAPPPPYEANEPNTSSNASSAPPYTPNPTNPVDKKNQ